MTLTLRPITSANQRHQNVYADWLDTLTEHQFHEHMAGRLHGPQIGGHSVSIPRMWLGAVIVALACFAILYIINHL